MKRWFFFLILSCVCARAYARDRAFGLHALDIIHPIEATNETSCVFGPFGYELSCMLFAEASDSIARAGIAERIGVLDEFEATYEPLLQRLEAGGTATNSFEYLGARAFLLPQPGRAEALFRAKLGDCFGAAVTALYPVRGAEEWLKAQLRGKVEDFLVPVGDTRSNHLLYYDFEYLSVTWRCVRPLREEIQFLRMDGFPTTVSAVRGEGKAGWFRNHLYTEVRLPLDDGASLFLLLPREGRELEEVRARVTSENLAEFLFQCQPAQVRLTMPELNCTSVTELDGAMIKDKIAIKSLFRLHQRLVNGKVRQRMDFRLAIEALPTLKPVVVEAEDEELVAPQPVAPVNNQEISLNRPFIYFIYHQETDTIPLVGVYTGLSSQE